MKFGSTSILRGVVVGLGCIVLLVCVLALPQLIISDLNSGADFDYGPIFAGLYVPAVPFFIALHQALKLLNYIDCNQAFTEPAVNALQNIKRCSGVIGGLFAAGMPYIFYVADRDDAPGLALIGFVIVGASLVIATFAAVMQKLVQSAVDIKSEHDLTV